LNIENVNIVHLDDIATLSIHENPICISMLEMESEFLASMDQKGMNLLRTLTDNVSDLIWLTGANILDKPNPNLSIAPGLSRALMLEQPSLRFSIVDLGSIDLATSDIETTCENVVKGLDSYHDIDDKEFVQKDGLLYISRFVPDVETNSLFRRRLGPGTSQEPMAKVCLSEVSPARLSIAQAGVTDSIYFQQISEPVTSPPSGFIDVDIKAVSLNAKDVYTIGGHVETRTNTTAIEISGIVAVVGPDVEFKIGDRVVVSAPNHFTTRERVPAWAAHKMLPKEDYARQLRLYRSCILLLYTLYMIGHIFELGYVKLLGSILTIAVYLEIAR
jgi:hypothetical protein